MNSDITLRKQLVALLKGGNAHMTFEEAIEDFPMDKINIKFPNGMYSSWGLLEHLRLTQWDILDFMTKSNYKEPNWPADYWPPEDKKASEKDWSMTVQSFKKDLRKLEDIVLNPKTDLHSKIPQGTGQTIIREILLVADHNAYHIGEFAIMRQVMKTWGKNHK